MKNQKINCMFQVYFDVWVHQEFSNEVYFKYTLKLFLKRMCISDPEVAIIKQQADFQK